jgi:hypothetical protein
MRWLYSGSICTVYLDVYFLNYWFTFERVGAVLPLLGAYPKLTLLNRVYSIILIVVY